MGTARIHVGAVNIINKDGTPRIHVGAVNLIFSETAMWEARVTTVSSVTASLTHEANIPVFSFAPLLGMKETLEWKTDIIRSRDGSEQRMSTRSVPRQGFQIDSYIGDEQEQAYLEAFLFRSQKIRCYFPVWSELTEHTDTIAVDSTTITLDTNYADYRDNSYALIWQSHDSFEKIHISSVSSDHLTLGTGTESTWTGTKWIMPLRLAYFEGATKNGETADGYSSFSCFFTVNDNVLLTGYTAGTTYNSLTVLTDATLEDGEREVEIDADMIFTDYGLHSFRGESDSDFNIYVQGHVFRNITRETCWDFREFLHSIYGRRVPVWIPSFKEDIVQIGTIGSSDTTFSIEDVGWGLRMQFNTLRTHLAFVFPDGTFIFREITNIEYEQTTSGSTSDTITIDSTLGVEVAPGDCEICFLDKCRLTEDKIEIEWDEPFRHYCRTNFTRVVS